MSNVFENIRNGKKVILVSENGDAVLVKFMDSDEEKIISRKTLKRWYKPCEDHVEEPAKVEEPVAEEPAKEPVVETPAEEPAEEPKEETPAPVENKKPEKKAKKAKEPVVDHSAIHSHILDMMNKKVEEGSVPGLSLFHSEKVSGFYSMKLDGKMVMNFTLSKKRGVVLWLRSAAVHGMATFEKFAHTFDARLAIAEWNTDNCKLISELFNASLTYQAEKNAKSASKKSKKTEKAE